VSELSQKEAEQLLEYWWSVGNLRGLLLGNEEKPHQLKLYDTFYNQREMTTVFHCSRRLGKSVVDLILLLEACMEKDGTICRFASATQKSVEEIIKPLMNTILQFCPAKLKPYWHTSGRYLFPHRPNSQLVIAGLDINSDRIRGNASHRVAIDEAGFVKGLEDIIKDIIMPQFLTTDGRLILSSTSPRTPAHDFVRRIDRAIEEKTYVKMTIYEDSRPEVIAKIPLFMKEAGGENSTTWRREYLCEVIIDEESALIPEFTREEVRSRVIQVVERPPHLIRYVAIDLGYIDNAAAVFGFVDFQKGRRVVIGEILLNRKNSKEICQAILAKEQELWTEEERTAHPLRRYADGQPLTIADFNDIHGLSVTRVSEDTVEAKVNQVRLDINSGVLQIDPSCFRLIDELKNGVWDKNHTKFARVEGTFAHFDLLSALTYFVRHTNLRENPYPDHWGLNMHTQMIKQPAKEKNPIGLALGLS
jgi:hypothetical protein